MLDIHGIEANKRALLEDLIQLIEEALQPFAEDLREFLERVRGGQFGSDWRDAFHVFVETQADAGFYIDADSVTRLVQLMESWERQTPGARPSEPTRIAVRAGDNAAQPDPHFMLASTKTKPKVRPGPSPPPPGPIPEFTKNAEGLEIAGPGPQVTDSFRKKTLQALEVLNPDVARWWGANSVQGDLRSRAGAWYQSNFKGDLEPNGRPVVTVDQHFTAGQAAQAIISEATGGYFADSIGAHYKKYHLARSKGVEEFRKWQTESVAEAGRQASILAEMYVNGIATLTPSGDLVVTIADLRERGLQWEHLITLLPLLHHLPIPAISLELPGRTIKVDKRLFRLLDLMLPEEQQSILKATARAKTDSEAKSIFISEVRRLAANRQVHHPISKKVYDALENNLSLQGKYNLRDSRFELLASSYDAHKGLQQWHIDLDDEIAAWLNGHQRTTVKEFEEFIIGVYNRPDLKKRFPKGLP
jgi:hypothetical protein